MKKNGKRLLIRAILAVVISLTVGIGVYSWNSEAIMHDPMPMPFGVGATVVLSGSMEPVLSKDDLVLVRKTDQYDVGDVVVYSSGGIAVIHEIVEIDGDTVTTAGRANGGVKDDPIPMDSIKGEAVFVIPHVGLVINIIKTPLVTAAILALACLLLVRSYRKDGEERQQTLEEIRRQIEDLKKQ